MLAGSSWDNVSSKRGTYISFSFHTTEMTFEPSFYIGIFKGIEVNNYDTLKNKSSHLMQAWIFLCHMTLIILCYVFYSECLRYCYCLSISISNIFCSQWLRYYYWFVRIKSFLRSNNYCEHTTNYYLRSNFSYIAIFFCWWIDRHKSF